jgi:hypothetical protein
MRSNSLSALAIFAATLVLVMCYALRRSEPQSFKDPARDADAS